MIAYLGRRLARNPGKPLAVRYLSKAEGEAIWRTGFLLSIDPQGACFATEDDGEDIAECLPWGSIAAIRINALKSDDGRDEAERERTADHAGTAVAAE